MRRLLIVLTLCLGGAMLWTSQSTAATKRSDSTPAAPAIRSSGDQAGQSGSGRPASQILDPERIENTIHAYLKEEWTTQVKDVDVAVLAPTESVKVPAGVMGLRVIPSRNGEGVGRRMFQVAVTVNKKPWKILDVHADVTAMIDAIVLNRSFRPDEVIDESDLKTIEIRISQLTHPFVTDQGAVVGKSAARPVPADVPLRQAFLKSPVVLKKGDRVLVEAKRGGLSIQTYGVSKSSGSVGQMIMVINPDSGRELRAKVVAPGLVEVEF
ncbi:MAG: flagellar basal body P-ring formation chaperone FlgA [Nitrospira sp.]|nr:flagellar basal body P-ring formation chaperone FlgA [Nitrospira sp.]